MKQLSTLIKRLMPENFRKSFETKRQVNRIDFDSDEIQLPREIFEVQSFLKISFCTTCMNRAHHLKHTLRKNIDDNAEYPNLEFVVLNYNSSDDLDSWIQKNMSNEIRSGRLKYARTSEPASYNSSHSKNVAHAVATGEVLVNVDADNFTGRDFAFFVNHTFQNASEPIIIRAMRSLSCAGRIAVTKRDFLRISGYNEKLTEKHFGYDDYDFVGRLEALGIRCINVDTPNFTRHIWHSDEERAENYARNDSNIEFTAHQNYEISRTNITDGKLRGNDGNWAVANLFVNFSRIQVAQQILPSVETESGSI